MDRVRLNLIDLETLNQKRPGGGGASLKRTTLDLVLLLASGFALALAFPPHSWWLLSFPAVGALIKVVGGVSPGRGAAYSAIWMMAFMLPLISWTQVATGDTYIAWFALAGAEAAFAAFWGAAFAATKVWKFARTIFGEAAVAALLWVAVEELRSRYPYGGFPWGRLAHPQVDSPLVAFAPLGGEVLVSAVVVFVSVLLMRSLTIPPRTSDLGSGFVFSRAAATFTALAILIGSSTYSLPTAPQTGSLRVAVIQGNVEVPMYETFNTPRKVTGNHARVTWEMLEAGNEVDLIVWGENAADIDPREDPETALLIDEVVTEAGVPAMLGIMEYEENTRYNWLAIWNPNDGLLDAMYGKQHPVPWGEYIPMRSITEILATAAAQVGVDMSPVDNPALLTVALSDGRRVPLVVGICFEVAYEQLLLEGILLGGEAITIPTNNAHFQNSAESVQQLQMGQFRAAEFSRAMIQASTNGVSAVVSPDGKITQVTGTQEADYLVADIPLRSAITPFAHVGSWMPTAVMVIGSLMGIWALVAHRRDAKGRRAND